MVAPHGGVHIGGGVGRDPRRAASTTSPPEVAASLMALVLSGDAPILQIRAVGGAVNDVAPDATAYAHRTQNFVGQRRRRQRRRLERRVGRRLAPAPERALPRASTPTRGPSASHEAFPGATLARLRELKAIYDPDNVFNQNFPITPADQLVSRR